MPEISFHVHVGDFTKKIKLLQGEFIFLVVYPNDKLADDAEMTREETRRENARKLAAGRDSKAEFARLVEMEPSQVSQLIGPNPVKNIGNSIARRIERAFHLPEGWLDVAHPEMSGENDVVSDNDGFAVPAPEMNAVGQRVGIGAQGRTVPIRAVKIKIQAGSDGYVTEPDFDIDSGYFQVPAEVIDALGVDPSSLIVTTFRGRSMEPMYFDGDKGLVDISKRAPVNNECFVVNWNGETLVKCLIKKSDGWCLYSFNRDYPSISVRSGHCSIIGMVVWQPARIVKGLL